MLNTRRLNHITVGNKFSAIAAAGVDFNSSIQNSTEEFDGSSWSAGGNLNSGHYSGAGAGIATAALSVDGIGSSNAELYNGSTWSVSGALNSLNLQHSALGISTAAIALGGNVSSSASDITEEFNGSTWTVSASLNTARDAPIAFGIVSSGIAAVGGTSITSAIATTESYNGVIWSLVAGGDVVTPSTQAAGSGISNNGIKSGGRTGFAVTVEVELFNGSVWTPSSTLDVGLSSCRSAGEPEIAILTGGSTTLSNSQAVDSVYRIIQGARKILSGVVRRDLFLFEPIGIGSEGESDETTGAILGASDSWVSGPQELNSGRFDFGSAGDFNSAVVFGGNSGRGSSTASSEIWNGTNWTSGNDMNSSVVQNASFGITSAAVSTGGLDPFGIGFGEAARNTTEIFNGSTWSFSGALNEVRYNGAGCGIQSAGIVAGGDTSESGFRNSTEHFNGSTWSTGGTLNAGRGSLFLVGIETAALSVGGENDSFSYMNNVETYNGTAWSTATAISEAVEGAAGAGIQNDAIFFGGLIQPELEGNNPTNSSYRYNGSSWTSGPDMVHATYYHEGVGSSSQAMAIGDPDEFDATRVQYLGRFGRTELLYDGGLVPLPG